LNWKVSMFYTVIDMLKLNEVSVSFWEQEENWASIHLDSKVVGYVWRKYPLLVLEEVISFQVENILKDLDGLYYIKVNSLSRDVFKIEDADLRAYVDINSFTMEDLWFKTNSE